MIGEAVPPSLAEAIATEVADLLKWKFAGSIQKRRNGCEQVEPKLH
jgi:hypothetical protein